MSETQKTEGNLSEVFPKAKVIKLPNDKELRIGVLTLEHALWIEEEFGDFDNFTKVVLEDDKTIKSKIELMYQLLENKDDFEDMKDFARSVPLPLIMQNLDTLAGAISESLPNIKPGAIGAGEATPEKK